MLDISLPEDVERRRMRSSEETAKKLPKSIQVRESDQRCLYELELLATERIAGAL